MLLASERSSHFKLLAGSSPVSVGAGFLALDLLLIGRDRVRANKRYAGGSCGNVLSILAYLGWTSYPVARLGTDRRAQILIDDLKFCHVNTSFVTKEGTGVTPAIVVRLMEGLDGVCKSRFEWKDPQTGDWLPRYRPLPKRDALRISPKLPAAKVFYFDRAEPSSLLLAKSMRDKGAIVFFEPSSSKEDAVFTACLSVSDIVKYSAERISVPPISPNGPSPRLEIQTLGDNGLRYRVKISSNHPGGWHMLPSFPTKLVKDTTGCGDWCSAGIISTLCADSRDSFLALSQSVMADGIRFGQALAAINAEYEGARGPMYSLSKSVVINKAMKMLDSD